MSARFSGFYSAQKASPTFFFEGESGISVDFELFSLSLKIFMSLSEPALDHKAFPRRMSKNTV